MRYWWVNQNKTFEQEVRGNYLWSPKRKSNRARNPYYETMREVAPDDVVFSFAKTRIFAFGIARSHAYECPKPKDFGESGRYWNDVGWRVDVGFQILAHPVRPADWMTLLRPLLPPKYSPLQPDGRGVQSIYLTELNEQLALALADLVSAELAAIARGSLVHEREIVVPNAEHLLWEEQLTREIESNTSIDSTYREALVLARRGQGLFRERVQDIEHRCRVTHVDRAEHLRASHCKPWRDADDRERLDGENGLLLTPSVDHLFDRGFISFEGHGRLLVSPVAHLPSLRKMGVPVDRTFDVGAFTERQSQFLEYHRDEVFLRRNLAG